MIFYIPYDLHNKNFGYNALKPGLDYKLPITTLINALKVCNIAFDIISVISKTSIEIIGWVFYFARGKSIQSEIYRVILLKQNTFPAIISYYLSYYSKPHMGDNIQIIISCCLILGSLMKISLGAIAIEHVEYIKNQIPFIKALSLRITVWPRIRPRKIHEISRQYWTHCLARCIGHVVFFYQILFIVKYHAALLRAGAEHRLSQWALPKNILLAQEDMGILMWFITLLGDTIRTIGIGFILTLFVCLLSMGLWKFRWRHYQKLDKVQPDMAWKRQVSFSKWMYYKSGLIFNTFIVFKTKSFFAIDSLLFYPFVMISTLTLLSIIPYVYYGELPSKIKSILQGIEKFIGYIFPIFGKIKNFLNNAIEKISKSTTVLDYLFIEQIMKIIKSFYENHMIEACIWAVVLIIISSIFGFSLSMINVFLYFINCTFYDQIIYICIHSMCLVMIFDQDEYYI